MFPFNYNIHPAGAQFVKSYHCFSVSCAPNENRAWELDSGGKIIMPPSALDALARQNIEYPMLFKLTNNHGKRSTHCGVLEFVADEGRIYIPYWMMRNLLIEEGALVEVRYAKLPIATFARFQPLSSEFLELSNPKAVLENILRSFACLTKGDEIAIRHLNKVYYLRVLELKPQDAVTIIECDMSVDFAPPEGYEESKTTQAQKEESEDENEVVDHRDSPAFQPFAGTGQRLDGKGHMTSDHQTSAASIAVNNSGIPDYNYEPGNLYFIRRTKALVTEDMPDAKPFEPFEGQGNKLRPR